MFNRTDNQPQRHTSILSPANPAETPLITPTAGLHVSSQPLTPSNRADCMPQAGTECAGGQQEQDINNAGRRSFITHVMGPRERIEQAEASRKE